MMEYKVFDEDGNYITTCFSLAAAARCASKRVPKSLKWIIEVRKCESSHYSSNSVAAIEQAPAYLN